MAAQLILISHAATSALRQAMFPLDEEIEEREIEKIAGLAWSAPRAKQIFSAPEYRTRQTAEALGLTAVVTNDLRDCNYGAWSGYSLIDIQSQYTEEIAVWLTDPSAAPHGGESIVNLIKRVERWMNEQHDAGTVLAVTHPPVIRSAIVHALNAPPEAFWRIDVPPLTLTDLRFNGRTWTLRSCSCEL